MKTKISYGVSLIVWQLVAYILNENETEVTMLACCLGGFVVISTLYILDEIQELKNIYKDKKNIYKDKKK